MLSAGDDRHCRTLVLNLWVATVGKHISDREMAHLGLFWKKSESVPSTHVRWLTTVRNSCSAHRGSDASGLFGHCAHVHIPHPTPHLHTVQNKIKSYNWFGHEDTFILGVVFA